MSSTEPPPDVLVRRAEPDDALACAALLTASRQHAGEAFPPTRHTPAEDEAFVVGRVRDSEVWVAVGPARPMGYLDLEGDWVHSLYVHPDAQGQGIGGMLLDLAKSCRPAGFALWVFVSNEPARRLYRRHGLLELETTDGSGNEEKAPDLRMAWPGSDPVGYLRGQIDAVDAEIATLVARRVALTSAIQRHKERPGREGRDLGREQEIAHRMAERAPDLDVTDLTRVVHTLVEVGLDVAERRGT